ncbi:MAG: cytochrome c [Chloroflexi bacterium]|nr:cytochrome c [Chloroflexota bacterium]
MICAALAACRGLGGEPPIVATAPPPEASDEAPAWRPDIANGARIYAERCVECHGESGDGQGELVLTGSVERPLDMTDRAEVAAKSPLQWFEVITEGRIQNLMPPWEAALSEAERWDVTLYAYSLASAEDLLALGERLWRENCGECDLPLVVPPVYSDVEYGAKLNRDLFDSALSQAEAAAVAVYARMQSLALGADSGGASSLSVGALSGRVEHGAAGGVIPSNTVAQLHYGNDEIGYRVAEAALGEDSEFRFEDIPLSADISYVLGVMYDERLFSRRVSAGEFSGSDSGLTITIYDRTNDPSVVSVAQVDLYIEPVRLADMGAGLRVSQFLTVRNRSDRVYTSGRGFDDGREAALLIQFPLGARLMSGDQDGRYVVIEDIERLPDSVIDTWPVLPGEVHDLLLEYWLPYEDGLRFEQAFNNRMEAEVTVTLAGDLELASGWLREAAADGEDAYRVFRGNLHVDGESELSFSISGDPFVTSSDDVWVVTSEALPALLIGALAAAALFIAMGKAKRRRGDRAGDIERLVKELARLEDDHDQGRINHDLYHHRRRELKAQLAEKMEANS